MLGSFITQTNRHIIEINTTSPRGHKYRRKRKADRKRENGRFSIEEKWEEEEMEVVVAAPGTILHGFLCDDVDGMINAVEMTELTSLTCPERVKRQKNKENNW